MREIFIPISCDFSLAAVNYMLDLARQRGLGTPLRLECQKRDELDRWSLVCEWGKVTSEGFGKFVGERNEPSMIEH